MSSYTTKGMERVLSSNAFIVSETDSKGIITFANDAFCEIAGYSLDELVGKPHNIVRHLDMPKVAFKGLWETIKKGEIWTGFVKNSSKTGAYYWVFATVYPTIRDGKQYYLSCRKKPTEDEIASHAELYKTLL